MHIKISNLKTVVILAIIFAIAVVLRFLYFPNDIYFGFDQARDAFATQEILKGHLKLIGPPTSFEGLRHGVLYYYLYAPFYFLGNGNPEIVSAFLRVFNSFGVILIFMIASVLFNKNVGFIAALLFAISFEQTQFAMYFNHPSFAVISILLMYLGLALLIFQKKGMGLIIALLGLGLSVQFEFILTYLLIPFLLILILFRRSININIKTLVSAVASFLLIISSFIIAEMKFSFRTIKLLPQLLLGDGNKSLYRIISTYIFEMGQVVKFSLISFDQTKLPVGILIFILFLISVFSKIKKQIIFLSVWFFSGIIVYFVTGGENLQVNIIQYHPNIGLSLSLLIFVSFLLYWIGQKIHSIVTMILVSFILFSNLSLIQKLNPYGSMPEINAQSFMLLSDEKKVLDYIYQDAARQTFAVKAITLPYIINTTWSYLFEWYGLQKYGYQPIWNGKNSLGYPGNLKVEEIQERLPAKRYLIIEPIRGIPTHLINDYIREENYFTKIIEEKEISKFKVQKRVKI